METNDDSIYPYAALTGVLQRGFRMEEGSIMAVESSCMQNDGVDGTGCAVPPADG